MGQATSLSNILHWTGYRSLCIHGNCLYLLDVAWSLGNYPVSSDVGRHHLYGLQGGIGTMREVRWIIQTSAPGNEDWRDTDETYTGWFYSDGNDKPTDVLLKHYEEAVERYRFLDVRLIQENRSHTVKELKREGAECRNSPKNFPQLICSHKRGHVGDHGDGEYSWEDSE